MVELQREGAVARIFLNRPQKVNALDSPMLERLAAALEEAGADETVRVVVLGGRGSAFCGGADVNELASLDATSARRTSWLRCWRETAPRCGCKRSCCSNGKSSRSPLASPAAWNVSPRLMPAGRRCGAPADLRP